MVKLVNSNKIKEPRKNIDIVTMTDLYVIHRLYEILLNG
jgi:hypothetical protein